MTITLNTSNLAKFCSFGFHKWRTILEPALYVGFFSKELHSDYPYKEVKSVTHFDCHFSVKGAANSSERQMVLKFDAAQDAKNKNKNRKIVGGDSDKLHLTFRVCQSVHHRTIQINYQPHATIFQFIILTSVYSSTCFGRFPVHHQELNDCSSSLWFYLRIVVVAVLCSWSGRPTGLTMNTARLSQRYEGKTRG
jgi:hypothetical protein